MTRSLLIKPNMDDFYPKAVRGSGIYLFDDSGKQYLDGSSGAVTASLGHTVPEIIEAMHEQSKKLSFVYRSQFTSDPAEKLAEKLNQLVNAETDYWSFFVNSGSEATETALKIAIQYWQERGQDKKNKILSRWISYHGITIGALSMSGHVKRRERFVPLLENYPSISAPYCYRCPFNLEYPDCQLFCASELETAIQRVGVDHVAAFIAEPMIGAAGGVIVPPKGYYEQIKEICDRYDILFIADEVMTGIGRTGKMFGLDHWNVKADIIALGKGMSAGYSPIAAALANEKVMMSIVDGSKSIMSGHTYSANPQSAAVALAVIDYIEKNQLVDRVKESGTVLFQKLANLKNNYPIIGNIRGKGLMIGIEFVADLKKKIPFNKAKTLTKLIVETARNKGLLLYPASAGKDGIDGDAIIISPPFTITKEEIDLLVTLFEETLRDVQARLEENI
ncbi:aspartate aminotransferase family protein [Salipaludibacillus neizhouensis]|uniref:Aspartate aminotransferase family protein n=1 Tax=Salipaludibacillus neizhouensis TaxID=885475 RepID=A0A3A9JZW2_9BACI|nr:aspartate aminotransferase family protein [Salipaludibacillus neizhouensis]RKL65699.1 aspartate aminotransferase family protein [Salipaludibacillus neizhouensis]